MTEEKDEKDIDTETDAGEETEQEIEVEIIPEAGHRALELIVEIAEQKIEVEIIPEAGHRALELIVEIAEQKMRVQNAQDILDEEEKSLDALKKEFKNVSNAYVEATRDTTLDEFGEGQQHFTIRGKPMASLDLRLADVRAMTNDKAREHLAESEDIELLEALVANPKKKGLRDIAQDRLDQLQASGKYTPKSMADAAKADNIALAVMAKSASDARAVIVELADLEVLGIVKEEDPRITVVKAAQDRIAELDMGVGGA